MKSMTAKLRHASKTEHHKYDYNESTGHVYRKDEIGDLAHMKGMSTMEFINELFLRKDFQSYMH